MSDTFATKAQLDLAAKFPAATKCPRDPDGTKYPFRVWVKSRYYTGTSSFETLAQAVDYLAYQHNLSIERGEYETYYYRDNFIQNCATGVVYSMADLGIIPVYGPFLTGDSKSEVKVSADKIRWKDVRGVAGDVARATVLRDRLAAQLASQSALPVIDHPDWRDDETRKRYESIARDVRDMTARRLERMIDYLGAAIAGNG